MKKTKYEIESNRKGSDFITTTDFETEEEALEIWNWMKGCERHARRGYEITEYRLYSWTFEADEDGEAIDDGVFDILDSFETEKSL